MTRKEANIKLDLIYEHYTQQELAFILVCTQWELLQKTKDNTFTKGDIRRINKLYSELTNDKT